MLSDRRICLVVASTPKGIIGMDGDLPWHLPADLAHFQKITMGHVIVMGRRTFEAIGKPLPGRENVVMTRDPNWHAEGAAKASTREEAIQHAPPESTVMVIGGGEIYRQFLADADVIERTVVHCQVEGDTRFPTFESSEWTRASCTHRPADDRTNCDLSFETWVRSATDQSTA